MVALLLQKPHLFMKLYERNPAITLAEIVKAECTRGEAGH